MRLTLICVKSFKHPWSFNQQHCSLRYNLNHMNPNPIYIISTCIYRRTRTTYLICYKVCVNGCCMYTCNITFFPFFLFFGLKEFTIIHFMITRIKMNVFAQNEVDRSIKNIVFLSNKIFSWKISLYEQWLNSLNSMFMVYK